jgi:colicin import membrane protein
MNNEVSVSQELIPVNSINVPELFTNRQLVEALLAKIDQKAREHEPDLSTQASRKRIASNAYLVSQSKTFLDGLGKDFVAERKAELKETDSLRKLIRDTLDALRDEVRKPLTDFEEAEAARLEAERAEAVYLQDWEDALAEDDLFNRRREIERKEAEIARQEAERKAKEEAERIERERKEREARIAKEAAERAEKEAAERIAKAESDRLEAIEKAKRDAELAEQRRIEAEKQAERDRRQAIKDSEDKARREAEQKERERLAAEAAEKAEAERKARNKAHRKAVNDAALVCFENQGIDTETAKEVIRLIASGLIDYITVNY